MSDQTTAQQAELLATLARADDRLRRYVDGREADECRDVHAAISGITGAMNQIQQQTTTEQQVDAPQCGYCAVCYHPLDRCSHCDQPVEDTRSLTPAVRSLLEHAEAALLGANGAYAHDNMRIGTALQYLADVLAAPTAREDQQ